jgi:hypothetical protein
LGVETGGGRAAAQAGNQGVGIQQVAQDLQTNGAAIQVPLQVPGLVAEHLASQEALQVPHVGATICGSHGLTPEDWLVMKGVGVSPLPASAASLLE